MSNCWKSHATAQFIITPTYLEVLVSTYFSNFLMEDMFCFKHVLECIPVKCHPTEKEEIIYVGNLFSSSFKIKTVFDLCTQDFSIFYTFNRNNQLISTKLIQYWLFMVLIIYTKNALKLTNGSWIMAQDELKMPKLFPDKVRIKIVDWHIKHQHKQTKRNSFETHFYKNNSNNIANGTNCVQSDMLLLLLAYRVRDFFNFSIWF